MTIEGMNALRPGDKIIFVCRKLQTRGRVLSVWGNDRVMIEWADGVKDTLSIDEENAKLLEKYVLPTKQGG